MLINHNEKNQSIAALYTLIILSGSFAPFMTIRLIDMAIAGFHLHCLHLDLK